MLKLAASSNSKLTVGRLHQFPATNRLSARRRSVRIETQQRPLLPVSKPLYPRLLRTDVLRPGPLVSLTFFWMLRLCTISLVHEELLTVGPESATPNLGTLKAAQARQSTQHASACAELHPQEGTWGFTMVAIAVNTIVLVRPSAHSQNHVPGKFAA